MIPLKKKKQQNLQQLKRRARIASLKLIFAQQDVRIVHLKFLQNNYNYWYYERQSSGNTGDCFNLLIHFSQLFTYIDINVAVMPQHYIKIQIPDNFRRYHPISVKWFEWIIFVKCLFYWYKADNNMECYCLIAEVLSNYIG